MEEEGGERGAVEEECEVVKRKGVGVQRCRCRHEERVTTLVVMEV